MRRLRQRAQIGNNCPGIGLTHVVDVHRRPQRFTLRPGSFLEDPFSLFLRKTRKPVSAGARSAQLGIGFTGMIQIGAPCSQACRSSSPCAFRGVWHSAHFATSSTRYRPRSVSPDSGDLVPCFARTTETTSATATNSTEKPTFVCILPPGNTKFRQAPESSPYSAQARRTRLAPVTYPPTPY